jgi:hypothetical protein
LSPFSHRFGRGIKGKRTTKGSCIYPPTNHREKSLEIAPRKTPRKDSEIHQKEKSGRTQTSLEEPRRIIYTYHEGSYKVKLPPDHPTLSQDLTMALKPVLEIPREKEEENSKTK